MRSNVNNARQVIVACIVVYGLLCAALFAQKPVDAIYKKDGKAAAEAFQEAIKENIRPKHRATLAPIVAAIRYAENGGKGKEYGILHPRVKPTYRSQAGWCAATVQKNYDRWIKAMPRQSFIEFLGARYCPVGAKNDPKNLNRWWCRNVYFYTRKFL